MNQNPPITENQQQSLNQYCVTANNQNQNKVDFLKSDPGISESMNLFLQAYNEVINNKTKKINPTVLRTFNQNQEAGPQGGGMPS